MTHTEDDVVIRNVLCYRELILISALQSYYKINNKQYLYTTSKMTISQTIPTSKTQTDKKQYTNNNSGLRTVGEGGFEQRQLQVCKEANLLTCRAWGSRYHCYLLTSHRPFIPPFPSLLSPTSLPYSMNSGVNERCFTVCEHARLHDRHPKFPLLIKISCLRCFSENTLV